MRLCGSDMDDKTTVLEAGLGWIVGWKKDDFLGAETLRRQKDEGLARKLVPFEMKDRAIARHGYPVVQDGRAGRGRDERHADAVPEEGDRIRDGAGRQ